MTETIGNNGVAASQTNTQPLWLLAEVTYRCPLHCAFCYNPTDYDKHTKNELTTEQWIGALLQVRASRGGSAAEEEGRRHDQGARLSHGAERGDPSL